MLLEIDDVFKRKGFKKVVYTPFKSSSKTKAYTLNGSIQ